MSRVCKCDFRFIKHKPGLWIYDSVKYFISKCSGWWRRGKGKEENERTKRDKKRTVCGYGYYEMYAYYFCYFFCYRLWIISWKAGLTIIQWWKKKKKKQTAQSIFHITGFCETRKINARQIFLGEIIFVRVNIVCGWKSKT